MKPILKKMILDQFKGESHAEYNFTEKTLVTGRNGAGKTRLADAWFWLIVDKDYSLKSSPEVHCTNLGVSEPSVTAVLDVDGKEVTLRKFQKDSRTKKQIEEGAPVRISNQYEVNAVPKSQKDFNAYLQEAGIDIDVFLLLSHPEVFTDQKSADCRKILFGMVSDVTDREIADGMTGCEDAGALLENYTVDEITALKKREKKEADENIEAIPNQIIGMEKAKSTVDTSEFLRQKETLLSEIQAIEIEMDSNSLPSIGELNQKLALLDTQEKQLAAEANADRVQKLTNLDIEIGELNSALSSKRTEMELYKAALANAMANKGICEDKFEELKAKFAKIKAEEYTAGDSKCPYCGQDLPVHRLDEAKTHFGEDKQKRMNEINAEGKIVQGKIKGFEKEAKGHSERMQTLDAEIIELNKRIADKKSVREPLERVVSLEGSGEHERILQERLTIQHQMEQRNALECKELELRRAIADKQQAIREIDDVLAQEKNNERIDSQIAELKEKQKSYAQARADAEKVLDQLSQISMKKNEMLTEQVNSHFKRVKWRLFRYQKNGEVVDDCTPLVLTRDGEYRDMNYSANTAAIELAKLDIINGLQEFYGQHLPVFLDGAECLDEESKKQISTDTQLIMLCVSEDELKVEDD